VRRSRDAIVRHLAVARRSRLVAAARAAGAGDEAEDAVQEVLAALAAGSGALPLDVARAEAYALTAVRRRARALGRTSHAPAAEPATNPDPAAELERRLGVRAFTDAIRDLPPRARAVLVLDAAGWPRAAIAVRLESSERAVKRILDAERAAAMARARRSLEGDECVRLEATLAAFGRGRGLPRPGGPTARHLANCPACRAALATARSTRTALESIFPPPVVPLGVAPPAPAPVVGLLAKGIAAALIGAILTAGSLHLIDGPHSAAPVPAATPLPARVDLASSPLRAMVPAASSVRVGRPRHHHHHRRRVPSWAGPRPPGSCTFGTLGICGTEG
jgi:DNA-directed RNA polymerase specialized sigma24 family protein